MSGACCAIDNRTDGARDLGGPGRALGPGRRRETDALKRRRPGEGAAAVTDGIERSGSAQAGSPLPRQETVGFQSSKMPRGLPFQAQTWSS